MAAAIGNRAPVATGRAALSHGRTLGERKKKRTPAAAMGLASENALLGALVDDLTRKLAEKKLAESPAEVEQLREQLRETEDVLLAKHEECQQAHAALRERDEALLPERQLHMSLKTHLEQFCATADVTEHVLRDEVAHLEQLYIAEYDDGYNARLRRANEDALQGMREAQAECKWLHEQLQSLLRESELSGKGSCTGTALRLQLAAGGPKRSSHASAACASVEATTGAEQPGGGGMRGGGGMGGSGGCGDGGVMVANNASKVEHSSGANVNSVRTAYVRAVQRCHELQLHAARTAESDAALRPELLRCRERIASLQSEVHSLRAQARRSVATPAKAAAAATVMVEEVDGVMDTPSGGQGLCMTPPSPAELVAPPPPSAPSAAAPAPAPRGTPGGGGAVRCAHKTPLPQAQRRAQAHESSSGGAAVAEVASLRSELARAHAKIGGLERAMERRECEHQADLDALYAAQREVEGTHRTLMSERAWVQSLDEMRLDDISTIMQARCGPRHLCLGPASARCARPYVAALHPLSHSVHGVCVRVRSWRCGLRSGKIASSSRFAPSPEPTLCAALPWQEEEPNHPA